MRIERWPLIARLLFWMVHFWIIMRYGRDERDWKVVDEGLDGTWKLCWNRSCSFSHLTSLFYPSQKKKRKKKWTLKLHRLKTTWIWSFMLMDQLSHNFEWWDIFGLIEIILLWIWGYLETMRAFFRFELETLTIILIETVVACTPC